ncbi:hypothetical protein [Streptomyces sp. NPDC053755]|uniref:hypothetical protein n=1 Tax=Streptomyces sp. NPDC053755 TaxID=3155815 RepID=UPI003437BB40
MIRHSVRALCAASLVLAPLALSTPAHAATACSVNGLTVPSGNVSGTVGRDYIQCSSVDAGHTVDGLAGDDTIVLTGPVAGRVLGGTGSDYLRFGSLAPLGGQADAGAGNDYVQVDGTVLAAATVRGGDGADFIRVDVNQGAVDGGASLDFCQVASGNPAVNC